MDARQLVDERRVLRSLHSGHLRRPASHERRAEVYSAETAHSMEHGARCFQHHWLAPHDSTLGARGWHARPGAFDL